MSNFEDFIYFDLFESPQDIGSGQTKSRSQKLSGKSTTTWAIILYFPSSSSSDLEIQLERYVNISSCCLMCLLHYTYSEIRFNIYFSSNFVCKIFHKIDIFFQFCVAGFVNISYFIFQCTHMVLPFPLFCSWYNWTHLGFSVQVLCIMSHIFYQIQSYLFQYYFCMSLAFLWSKIEPLINAEFLYTCF